MSTSPRAAGGPAGETADGPWNLPVQPPLAPMLAKLSRSIPEEPDGAEATWLFEPKWGTGSAASSSVTATGSSCRAASCARSPATSPNCSIRSGGRFPTAVWSTVRSSCPTMSVVAKPLAGAYEPGRRSLLKVKHQRTADCAVAGYRVHKDGKGVGSLLLGLFDDAGDMHPVGVAASFTTTRRAELLAELEPRTHDALDGHPWRRWVESPGAGDGAASPSGGSRWNAGKDLSFVPIRMGLVAEVSFGQLENRRFRHGVSFLRWRPDRTPESCRFDQLDVAGPVSFHDVVTMESRPRS